MNSFIYYCDFKLLLYNTLGCKIVIQPNNLKSYLFKHLKNYLIKEQTNKNQCLLTLLKPFPFTTLHYLLNLINSFITNKIHFFTFLDLSINNYNKYSLYNYIIYSEQNIKYYILSNYSEASVKDSYNKIKG